MADSTRNLSRSNSPTLVEIVTALSEVYDDAGATIWLKSPQQRWGVRDGADAEEFRSALDVIGDGEPELVMQAIDQLRSGSLS